MTLSLILRFNLRLGGYSIWSATTHRTLYLKIFEDFKTTRARAPHSLSTAREVLRKHDLREVLGATQGLRSTQRSATIWLRKTPGLVRPGATRYLVWHGPVRDIVYSM